MVGFPLLDPVSNDLTREDVSDLVGLEPYTREWGEQVGDIPTPDLSRPGGLEDRDIWGRALMFLGRDLRAQGLVLDLGSDSPPGTT